MNELAFEIEEINGTLFKSTYFYFGHPRNPYHLRKILPHRARAIIVLGADEASEASDESTDLGIEGLVQTDRHRTVTSLNLHIILEEYRPLYDSDMLKEPFIIIELIHEINICLLRELKTVPNINLKNDNFNYDWPLITAGSVLCHSMFDGLMVSSIFNPNILKLWESILQLKDIFENHILSDELSQLHRIDQKDQKVNNFLYYFFGIINRINFIHIISRYQYCFSFKLRSN